MTILPIVFKTRPVVFEYNRSCFEHDWSCSTCSQDDLDKVVGVWDQHLIRPSKNERVPHGRPMYNLSELYGSTERRLTVSSGDLEAQEQYCTFRKSIPCDRDMFELCHEIMEERSRIGPPKHTSSMCRSLSSPQRSYLCHDVLNKYLRQGYA